MGLIRINGKHIGLTQETEKVYERVSLMDCLKGLYLCGGTAQSLQMGHRLSEDLDFELIGTRKDRPKLDFHSIITELKEKFDDARIEILGDEQFLAYISEGKVKLSFFRPENPVPSINIGYTFNNINAPTLQDLLGMKVFTTGVRSEARDYYDIYCLVEAGCELEPAVKYAGYFSRYKQKSKDIYTRLLTPQLYNFNEDFYRMQPKYKVTPEQIRDRIQEQLVKENNKEKKDLTPKI